MKQLVGGLIIIICLGVVGLGYWVLREKVVEEISTGTVKLPSTQGTDATMTENLETYVNGELGFSLAYPKRGALADMTEGICGAHISEQAGDGGQWVYVDDLAIIWIMPWEGTIAEYLLSQKAADLYTTETVINESADEALALVGLNNPETKEGYLPLVYVQTIYRKGDRLYLFMSPQAVQSLGCIQPSTVPEESRDLFPTYYLEWDYKDHFRLL